MASTDTVLAELDAEIASLEDELRKARELRGWWARRHPPGDAPAPPQPVRLRNLPDYVRYVLRDGTPRLSTEIVAEAKALGWSTTSARPDQLVRNALRDMGDAVTVKNRYYSLRPTGVITELFGDLTEPGRAAG